MLRRSSLAAWLAVAAAPLAAAAPPPAPPRPVRVQAVTLAPRLHALVVSGIVQARTQADLAFRVGGKIVRRPVEVGDHVRAGEALASLDPADLGFSQQAAEAALLAAEADAGNARVDLRRYVELGRASPAYLPSEYDKRLAAERGAEARMAQARHALELARDQSGYGVLRADAAGIVTSLLAQVGQVVASGQTVATIARLDDIEVAADVPEDQLAAVRAAGMVRVELWALPGLALRGRVREIGALADPSSRTFRVKVTLLDPPVSRLALGMTASLRFDLPAPMLAVLPASALADQAGRPAVWVLDRGTRRAALRPVSVAGYTDDGSVLVSAGLSAGEQVVTAGVGQIAPDMPLVAWTGANR